MGLSYTNKAEGIASVCGPYGELAVVKTVTCAHCDRIMHVSPYGDATGDFELPKEAAVSIVTPKREPPSVCHICWSLVCPQCHADGRCTPLLKRIDEDYSKRKFFEAVGI